MYNKQFISYKIQINKYESIMTTKEIKFVNKINLKNRKMNNTFSCQQFVPWQC